MWQQEKEHLRGGVKTPNLSTLPISPFGRWGAGQGIVGLLNTEHVALQEPCPAHTQHFEKDNNISR